MEIEDIIQLLINKTGKIRDEILTLIEKKQLEAGGTISDKAAASLVAKDLGLKLSEVTVAQPTKIKDLLKMAPGSSNITITGIIKRTYAPYHFSKEDATRVVQNLVLVDSSSTIRVVIWGNMVKLVKNNQLMKGDQIRIIKGLLKNGRMGEREIHLNDSSAIEKIDAVESEDLVNVWSDVLFPSSVSIEQTKVREIDLQGAVVSTFIPEEPERPANLFIVHPDVSDQIQLKVNFWRERKEEISNLEIGTKVLLEGVSIKEGRQNTLEANFNRSSNISILGKINDVSKLKELENNAAVQQSKQFTIIERDLGSVTMGENFTITVRIAWKGPLGSFVKKTGEQGNFIRIGIYDTTGSNIIVLWNEQAVEADKLQAYDLITITNAYLRENRGNIELSLSRNGTIEKSSEDNGSIPKNLPAIPINAITKNWKVVSLWAGILSENDVRTFKRNDGSNGSVKSIEIADNTGELRLVAWNDGIELLKNVHTGEIISVENVNVRTNNYGDFEVHLSKSSTITVQKQSTTYPDWIKEFNFNRQMKAPKQSNTYERISIDKLTDEYKDYMLNETDYGNDYSNFDNHVELKANIVDVFDSPLYYEACPECSKKVEKLSEESGNCPNHNIVIPVLKLLIRVILDDGLNTMVTTVLGTTAERLTNFNPDSLKKFLIENNDDKEILKNELKDRLLGNEYLIRGRLEVRKNYSQEEEYLWNLRINYITLAEPKYELNLLEK